jgi:hypothetical protein
MFGRAFAHDVDELGQFGRRTGSGQEPVAETSRSSGAGWGERTDHDRDRRLAGFGLDDT